MKTIFPHHKMMPKWTVFIFLLCVTGITVFSRTYFHLPGWFCSCKWCSSEDYLSHRFDNPLLCGNCSLSEDDFNWWKKVQLESRSFSTYKSTVDRLFQMFPSSPDLTKPRPDRRRTCSVVGNSNNLKGSRYGRLIDAQDVVIRMNMARTEGFETDVGTRTTHRVMYPESAMDLDNTTHLVLFAFKIMDLDWLLKAFTTGFFGRSYAPVKSKIKANKDLVMVVNPGFMRYVHDLWLKKEGSYPSTGFMTLVLALHICDDVNVFGYGADSKGAWSHYWEELQQKTFKTGVHPGYKEYEIIQQLAQQQKIKFYRGW